MMKAGADINARDLRKRTVAHYAVLYNRENSLRLMVKNGAMID